jgi:hypothetical protein
MAEGFLYDKTSFLGKKDVSEIPSPMSCYFWFKALVLYLPLALKDNTCFFKRERKEYG